MHQQILSKSTARQIVLFLALSLAGKYLCAQNMFSQPYSSPHIINPANIGRFIGDYRIGGIRRNENGGSSKTNSKSSFYADTRLLNSILPENEKLAVGVAFLGENRPIDGIKNNYLLVSMAYHKGLNEEGSQELGAGFQVNFSNKQINPPSLVFEDQLNNWLMSGFSLANPFQSKSVNINYLDFNAGLTYQNLIKNKNLVSLGVSVFHANHPTRSFDAGEFALSPAASIQLGSEYAVSNTSKIYSSVIVTTAKEDIANDLFISSVYQAKINSSNYTISGGASYRNSKAFGIAIIPSVGLGYHHILLNISYDVNVSKSRSRQGNALEIGMVFLGKKIPKR